jgi:glycerophosphoryl diester phosphodiesterase
VVANATTAVRPLLLALALALATPAAAGADAAPRPRPLPTAELSGFAVLPAATFGPGPPSGQYGDDGRRAPRPRFQAQPVQGLSSIQPGPAPGTWWGLSDNGYALRWNSFDFRLVIHLFDARPERRDVRVLRRIELRDPRGLFPWRLAEESLPGRPLTGADVDPESLAVMADGSFWVGDEMGPWLLHFSPDGELLAPPVELPEDAGGALRSASHPQVLAGRARARLRSSRGFESLAAGPGDGATLLAMLEGSVEGDPPGVLRIYEFDPARVAWTGRRWQYRLQDPAHLASELARLDADGHYLVLERDDLQGDAARFKQVLGFALGRAAQDDAEAPAAATGRAVVDLLRIPDPRGVAGFGSPFRFPFWTPECLIVLDPRTLLVVADNNFPATGGRSTTEPDPTEWIWIRARDGFAASP